MVVDRRGRVDRGRLVVVVLGDTVGGSVVVHSRSGSPTQAQYSDLVQGSQKIFKKN